MGHRLPPKQLELYQRIDEILFYKWDPIGISDSSWSRDEYQSYLPQVFRLALENNNPQPIAEYLGVITTVNMGLPLIPSHDLTIAELIMDIKIDLDL